MSNPLEISPAEVKRMIDERQDFHFIDVRERAEYQTTRVAGTRLIPMADIPAHLSELDDERPVVLMCHHGVRSLHAANWLRQNGVDAQSMQGGIDLWSTAIDPTVPRY